jgi:hypothetical protein
MSMLANLETIRTVGLQGLLEQEAVKWRCHRCGGTLCCHNGLCLDCDLEALRMNKKHRAQPISSSDLPEVASDHPVIATVQMVDRYAKDRATVLSHRLDNGGDYWATTDLKLAKGGPFSTLESALLLVELGMPTTDPVLLAVADLFFSCLREDGRFRLAPGAIYPCQTIQAFLALSRLGYANDPRLAKTIQHLLAIQHTDGGWRCNKFSFGRGPETESSNPGPTLTALNAFRHTSLCNTSPALDRAVEFLLAHWTTRQPIGPCHYGIGTLFMQVEYPFMTYNLFQYVYVLSFYERARHDERFLDALRTLEAKLVDGQIVVERVNSKLAGLDFCRKGQPSELGTARFQEIVRNLG